MSAVRELLREATANLSDAGESTRIEAEILLAEVLERPRSWLFAWPEHRPRDDQVEHFRRLVARRRTGEPVAYLVGWREFWSLRLKVTPATLIPRPETEHLVEAVLGTDLRAGARVLELGTGSGAIAIALAHERHDCTIVATDRSTAALAVARRNARRLELRNIDWVAGHWFEPLSQTRRFDTVVSNPPYVAEQDPHLARGDPRFEPRAALAAGADGLDDLRLLIERAPDHLVAGGWLWLEHGEAQGAEVRALLQARGFSAVTTGRDLAGLERYSGGQLPAA
jgi:release factor glutamine methyltransferase